MSIYSAEGRRLCFYLCLFVRLSLCLSVRLLKVTNGTFWRDEAWPNDQSIRLWWRSGFGDFGSRIFLKDIIIANCINLVNFFRQVAALVSADVCVLRAILVYGIIVHLKPNFQRHAQT